MTDKELEEMGFERDGDFEVEEYGPSHKYYYDDSFCIDKNRLKAGVEGAGVLLKMLYNNQLVIGYETPCHVGSKPFEDLKLAIKNLKIFLGVE